MPLEMLKKVIEVATYCLLLSGIAFLANRRKRKTFDSYILADRQIPWFLIGFTLIGTWVGGGTLIAMVGEISTTGIAFIAVPIGISIGFLVLGIFSSYYRHSVEDATVTAKTLVQRLSDQYGSSVRIPCFIIISLLMCLFMAIQLHVGALILRHKLGLDVFWCSLFFGLIVALYTLIGGTRGDIWTDLFQVLVIFLSIFASLIFVVAKCRNLPVPANLKEIDTDLLNVLRLGPLFIVGSLLLSTFAIHTDAGIQQKLLVATNDREARRGAYFASIMYLLFGLALIAVVILAVAFKDIVRGDEVLFQVAERFLPFPLSFLLPLALLLAVLSTIDSELLLMSAMFVNDIYIPVLSGKYRVSITDGNIGHYKLARAWVIVCFVVALGLSFIIGQLFDVISTLWVAGIGCLGLPLIGLIFKRIGEKMPSWFVTSQMVWSALIVALVFLWATRGNRDLTKQMVQLGMLLLLINFTVMWIIYGVRRLITNM